MLLLFCHIIIRGFLYFLVYCWTGMENFGNDGQDVDGDDSWEGV